MSEETPPAARDLAAYERDYLQNDFEAVQARLRKRLLLELLDRRKPRRVLEVGCGVDTLANHWTAAARFVVVEPAAGFADRARADLAGRADAAVLQATLEDAAGDLGAEEPFDLILLSGLLNELADPDGLMAVVRGLCGPDTLVHVNVANARSVHRLLAVEMGLIRDPTDLSPLQKRLQQHRIFTQDSLERYVTGRGFEVVERGDYFIKPFTHAQMQQLRDAGFLTEAMIEGLWGLARHMPGLGSEIFVNMRLGG